MNTEERERAFVAWTVHQYGFTDREGAYMRKAFDAAWEACERSLRNELRSAYIAMATARNMCARSNACGAVLDRAGHSAFALASERETT